MSPVNPPNRAKDSPGPSPGNADQCPVLEIISEAVTCSEDGTHGPTGSLTSCVSSTCYITPAIKGRRYLTVVPVKPFLEIPQPVPAVAHRTFPPFYLIGCGKNPWEFSVSWRTLPQIQTHPPHTPKSAFINGPASY